MVFGNVAGYIDDDNEINHWLLKDTRKEKCVFI